MRSKLSFICTAIFLIATCQDAVASDQLNGEMAKLSFLIGKWACKDYLRDTTAVPSVSIYEIAPRNTIHKHWSSRNAEGDSYFGYDSSSHEYYVISADNAGTYVFGTSADGERYSETLQGSKMAYKITATFQAPSSDTLKIRSVATINGRDIDGFEDCNR